MTLGGVSHMTSSVRTFWLFSQRLYCWGVPPRIAQHLSPRRPPSSNPPADQVEHGRLLDSALDSQRQCQCEAFVFGDSGMLSAGLPKVCVFPAHDLNSQELRNHHSHLCMMSRGSQRIWHKCFHHNFWNRQGSLPLTLLFTDEESDAQETFSDLPMDCTCKQQGHQLNPGPLIPSAVHFCLTFCLLPDQYLFVHSTNIC